MPLDVLASEREGYKYLPQKEAKIKIKRLKSSKLFNYIMSIIFAMMILECDFFFSFLLSLFFISSFRIAPWWCESPLVLPSCVTLSSLVTWGFVPLNEENSANCKTCMNKRFPEVFRHSLVMGKWHVTISQGAAIYKKPSLAFSFGLIF